MTSSHNECRSTDFDELRGINLTVEARGKPGSDEPEVPEEGDDDFEVTHGSGGGQND
jgi:hypothetical protein